jgi:CelD/BcsL family acetyltransferase involved in cellulose biosynthesis
MHFNVIRSLTEMETLADEWNTLLSNSASHVPFLRHEYLTAWWKTLGGGEWKQAELFVITARAVPGGALLGIAPLFFTLNKENKPALMLLGSIEISDYLDVIARPEHLAQFLDGLLEFLTGPEAPAWRVLDWYNLLESSPTLKVLEELTIRRGYNFSKELLQHCPYIPLPGDWQTYLESIEKKQRHEIRRKMRRALDYEKPVRWYIVDKAADLDEEIEAFLQLMAQDPQKDKFLSEMMRTQMKTALRAAFQAGWLQLAFIEVGGEKAAAYLNFDDQDHIWVYNSGLDVRFRDLSLGWVLLGYLIQWAINQGRRAFDFMRGDEEYKYRFGAIDRRVVRVQVSRNGPVPDT